MKNLIVLLVTVLLSSCSGGGNEEPKPIKTDLQKVQEAVAESTWTLIHARVIANGQTFNYDANCNFDPNLPSESRNNIFDYKYIFSTTKLSFNPRIAGACYTQSGTNIGYTVTKVGDKYVIGYNHDGSFSSEPKNKFEIQNKIEDIEDSEITVKVLTLTGTVTSEVKLTFLRN
jgi:hypothetical protein